MFSLVIYLVAGLTTGWQVFQQIMWSVWGAPTNPIQFVGLLGAWGLDVAGVLALKKQKASLVIGAFGLLGLWIFYVPALYQTIHSAQDAATEPFVFVAPALLVAATVYFGLDVALYVRKSKASNRAA